MNNSITEYRAPTQKHNINNAINNNKILLWIKIIIMSEVVMRVHLFSLYPRVVTAFRGN